MIKDGERKKLCVSSLVLGIVGLVFSVIVPAVSYACAIPGLVIGLKRRRRNYNSTAGVALSIIALSLALLNSVFGVLMTVKMFFSEKNED